MILVKFTVATVTSGALIAGLISSQTDVLSTTPNSTDSNVHLVAAKKRSKVLINESFRQHRSGSRFNDNARIGRWNVNFAGYGSVSVVNTKTKSLRLRPKVAANSSNTHAALVTSRASLRSKCLDVRSTVRTTKQLRQSSKPNPWEVAWLVWDFKDNANFSYLIAKPNGWELGKRDPAYEGGQRFLSTGSNAKTKIGAWAKLRVVRKVLGNGSNRRTATLAYLGSRKVTSFVDRERPNVMGKIGLYSEDATVDFDKVSARTC